MWMSEADLPPGKRSFTAILPSTKQWEKLDADPPAIREGLATALQPSA